MASEGEVADEEATSEMGEEVDPSEEVDEASAVGSSKATAEVVAAGATCRETVAAVAPAEATTTENKCRQPVKR